MITLFRVDTSLSGLSAEATKKLTDHLTGPSTKVVGNDVVVEYVAESMEELKFIAEYNKNKNKNA